MSEYTRRNFIGAAGAAGLSLAAIARGQSPSKPGASEQDRSRSDPGPTNKIIDQQNPDSFTPPASDAGGMPPFKYPFSLSNKRLHEGGWSREVTVRDLAIAKDLAGVDMRLTAGGIRELHWHNAGEWALMLYGNARITCIDADGKAFVADVTKNDLWYFPTGLPHSIQGLGPDGTEFLLVFDDGAFSEFNTVLLTDWLAHTPREVLAKNFGVKEEALAKLPKHELFIFQAPVPGSLEADRKAAAGQIGLSPIAFNFNAMKGSPTKETKSGDVRIIDSKTFKISTTIAAAIVTVKPGGLRELHWHPNADEWQYFIEGKGRMTVFGTGGHARTEDFQAGDVGYIGKTLPHYIENTGDTDLRFLEMFKSGFYQDLALSEWITHAPPELIIDHLRIDKATLDAIPKVNRAVVPL
jgi:oxalate decarboxylase